MTPGGTQGLVYSGGTLYLIDDSSPTNIYALNVATGASTLAKALTFNIASATGQTNNAPIPTPISNSALITLTGLLGAAGWWSMHRQAQS